MTGLQRATFFAGAALLMFAGEPGHQATMKTPQSTQSTVPITASTPYIDTHVHFDAKVVSHPAEEVDTALQEMAGENAARLIFQPGPFLPGDAGKFDHEAFVSALKKHAGKLSFQSGGGSLNPMIQEALRSQDTSRDVQRRFKERAEQIIRDGAVGFGEMSAEHLSFSPGQVYETAPPDHPLFLLLADIAAEHGVPIDLHLDIIPRTVPLPLEFKSPVNPAEVRENVVGFERLLDHNPRAKILWAQAGSDQLGYRTPELCRSLLHKHANLFMAIKVDPLLVGKNPPLANGEIKPEWLKLFKDFPDRFVIGTDQHYASGHVMTGTQRWSMAVLLLNQLPEGLRHKIASGNALRIFPIPETK